MIIRKVFLTLSIVFFSAVALSCPQEELLKDKNGNAYIYFLNQNNVSFFDDAALNNAITTPKPYNLGESFFASQEGQDSIRLVKNEKTSDGSICIFFAGWVDKQYLLTGNFPVTVGEVVKEYKPYFKKHGVSSTGLTENNQLSLKALTRPEAGIFEPRVMPGENSDKTQIASIEMAKYLWRYVYAAQEYDKELWYLVGGRSKLLTTSTSKNLSDPRYTAEAQQVLFGWIKAADTSPWPSVLALECNTIEAAVEERRNKNKPCTMFKDPQEDYQPNNILAQEDFLLWQQYDQNPTASDLLVRPQPFGWDPMIPRYHVQGSNREFTDWYQVATLGNVEKQVGAGDIAQNLRMYQQLLKELLRIDLVFVIDRSGSMGNEITAVTEFLKDLAKKISALRKEENLSIPGFDQGVLTGQLEINISLLTYVDSVTPVFIQYKLPDDIVAIEKAFQNIQYDIGGGSEYIHMALKAAIDPQIMPQELYTQRHVVLITDEPGDITPTVSKESIYEMMKTHLELGFQRLQNSDIPTDEEIKKYTRIWVLYTEKYLYNNLVNNIDIITDSDKVIQIPDFENQSSQAQREQVNNLLLNSLGDSTKRVEALITELTIKGNITNSVTSNKESIVGTRLAQAAIKDLLAKYPNINLDTLNAAFVQGEVNTKSKDLTHDVFVPVISLSETELVKLHIFITDVSYYLDIALNGSARIPSENYMMVLFFAMYAYITGESDLIDKFENNINEFVREAQTFFSKPENLDINLAQILNYKDSVLTLSKSALLTKSVKELQAMSDQEIQIEAEALQLKGECLNLVRKNQTIPLTYQECNTHNAENKSWQYVPPGGREGYYYIPQEMIP